ncbi:MAG TPA: hypothetical protein VN150_05510, partial [Ochrobactrum sp.]|nr:hypothetical protein [Ochrobactrum sp.]
DPYLKFHQARFGRHDQTSISSVPEKIKNPRQPLNANYRAVSTRIRAFPAKVETGFAFANA